MTSRPFALTVLMLSTLAGCADLDRGPAAVEPEAGASDDGGTPDDGGASETGALSFATDIRPLVQTCVRCHSPGQQAGDTQLILGGTPAADDAAVRRFVDTSAPSGS